MITLTLKRLLLAASICCLVATANAAPMDDALAAHQRGDYAQALNILRPLAAQGNVRAQFSIGAMYDSGHGVTQDYQEALKWYRLAANQGNASAQYNIGASLYYAEGVTQSYQEALKWSRLAAAKGAEAQYNIGVMYYNGQGVTKNHQEALKWFRHAADQGNADAIENLKLPNMIAAARNSTPDRRSTSIKTGTQQEEQVSIKTNQKIDQPRRTANRTETPKEVSQQSSNSNWQPVDSHQPHQRASPPKLVFDASAPKSDGTVELSGHVISDASISEILINGRALEVSLGRDKSFTVTRGLPMGAVTSYRLSVMDEYGQKADAEINVERAAIQYAEQVAPLNPRKLKAHANPNAVALIIGVESYSNLPPAQYADSDANQFYDYANQSLGVPPHKIKLLTDSKANRTELLKAMRSWMKTEVNGKSDVYIFFAGHGLASADGSKTYLLPADGDRDLLDETSILRDDLIASAKGAKTITMFLDTCYSGGTRTNEVLLADARPIAIVPDMKALPSNVTVLAAASGAQLSSTYEAAQQGLFSYWLMKGLEGDADTNKDKKITAGELHEYVAKQVGPMAQRRNRQQNPQLMGDSTRVLVSY
jgi:tetratricopeptide (TPR) repeat protein